MPDLVISNLNATLRAQLRAVAAKSGRPIEDEARRLLAQALTGPCSIRPTSASNDDVSGVGDLEIAAPSNMMRVSGSAQLGLSAPALPRGSAGFDGTGCWARRR